MFQYPVIIFFKLLNILLYITVASDKSSVNEYKIHASV